jgi:hypothetical protein
MWCDASKMILTPRHPVARQPRDSLLWKSWFCQHTYVNYAIPSCATGYTDEDSVAINLGFYYMANAGDGLLGTLLSGLIFQAAGFNGCLWGSAAMVLLAAIISLGLPRGNPVKLDVAVEGAE